MFRRPRLRRYWRDYRLWYRRGPPWLQVELTWRTFGEHLGLVPASRLEESGVDNEANRHRLPAHDAGSGPHIISKCRLQPFLEKAVGHTDDKTFGVPDKPR